MKITVSVDDFCEAFRKYGRGDNFTRAGLFALFDYLESYEQDTGEEVELDPIAICCDYSEYASAWDAMYEYQPDDMPTPELEDGCDLVELDEAQQAAALEWLEDRTTVIQFDDGVIIQAF
jgi:hypothetical protein